MSPSLSERRALSDRLRVFKSVVAEAVTREFYQRHPDWVQRFGEAGRTRAVEDAAYHIDFLAGALESASTGAFETYARWACRVLQSRGIAPRFVVETLDQIEQALASRLPPAEHRLVAELLSAGRTACEEPPPPSSPGSKGALAPSQALFRQAILGGHRQAAATIVSEALREGHPVLDVYADVVQESLYQVGALWETNQISVAEEHLATAIAIYVLGRIYDRLPRSARSRGKMVLTGVRGEMHQVGAHIVADALEVEGYDVLFLGTNLPHDGILQRIEHHGAEVLGISATLVSNLPQAIRLVESVRARFGPECPRIVMGGAAIGLTPKLSAELGVESAADVRGAVRLLCG